jgi:hypothetical protein
VVGSFISNECDLSIKRTTHYPAARNNNTQFDLHIKWVQGKAKLNMGFIQTVFLFDDAEFNINWRPSYAHSDCSILTIQTVSRITFRAICMRGIVNIDIEAKGS